MIIGVLKEIAPETRVSLIADGVAQLTKKKLTEQLKDRNLTCSGPSRKDLQLFSWEEKVLYNKNKVLK